MTSANPAIPEATYYTNYSDPEDDDEDQQANDPDNEEEDFFNDHEDRHPSTPGSSPVAFNQNSTAAKRKSSTEYGDPSEGSGAPPGRPLNGNGFQDPHRSTSNSSSIQPTMDPLSSKKMKPEPLEPSVLNAEPLDEFILQIADWIYQHAFGKPNIEIEAKVGILVDRRGGERLNLPVLNETILSPDYPDIRFESNMSQVQHANYNRILNGLVQRSNLPAYPHARVHYEHTRVTDSFYPSSAASSSASSSNRIRLTTDDKTQQVKECVQKVRLADLNIFSPCRKMDWRVSVSQEIPAARPIGQAVSIRKKDRISYSHQSFKIDLTQVAASSGSASAPGELVHELELEVADASELMKLAQLRARGPGGPAAAVGPAGAWNGKDSDLFDEMVRVFVNNIRILVRNAA